MSAQNPSRAAPRRVPLQEVATVIMGQSPPSSAYNATREGLPFFQGKAEFGPLHPTPVKWCTAPTKIAEAEDVLMSVRAPVGPTNIATERCCIGRGLAAIRPNPGVRSKWLFYAFRSMEKAIDELGTGTTFKAISGEKLRQLEVPIAPVAHQDEVLEEIEKQFSRLDEAVANLERVKANLKRYNAAVLKAAVDGRLVPTEAELARREGRSYETGEQLLQRILEVRRSQRKGPRRYREPTSLPLHELPERPEGWTWATVDQLLAHVTDGDHQPPPQTESGVPFLVIGNVRNGEIDFADTRFVGRTYYESIDQSRQPRKGDLLYTLVGSYGIPVSVTSDQPFCVQRHIAILRPHSASPIQYLSVAMASDSVFKQSTACATGTAQLTVPLGGLRAILVPLPPLAEQHRIVAEVDRRLSIVREVEAEVDANLKRAQGLRHSVLSSVFSPAALRATMAET